MVIFLYLFHVIFLDKEVPLESQSPQTNRHIEIRQYDTGVFNLKTIQVCYFRMLLDINELQYTIT